MKIAYIMRGVSGSGKTPRAKELAGENGSIHSTSDYFMVGDKYFFDRDLQRTYHEDNYDAFVESLALGVPVVICDNTNVKKWEYTRYIEAAENYGYQVRIETMPHPEPEIASKGAHKVPAEQIQRQIDRWQD